MDKSTRVKQGEKIANKDEQVEKLNDRYYHVKSQTSDRIYDVVFTELGWLCSCPDNTFRAVHCKHIHAVQLIENRENPKQEVIIKQFSNKNCPACKSLNIVKHGIRHNKNYDLQRYSCRDCNKRFSFNLGFERMKSNPKTITSAMQLYFTGESLRNVQKFLRLQGVEVSHKTIYFWVKKYTKLMESYFEKIVPKVSDVWRADEIYTKIKGDMKYLFALIDDETRFWIAQEVADRKEGHDASNLFQLGKRITGIKPRILITDGLRGYQTAYNKAFWTNTKPRPIHIRNIAMSGERNNNKMERFNGEFRDREKIVRGLKKADSPLISGYQIYHNYVRPHMSLEGKTPAEKCGIEVQGKDKWQTLIQNASSYHKTPSNIGL